MVRLISRQRWGLAALKLTKLFGIDDFPAAKDSGKVLIIIIYCYLIIIVGNVRCCYLLFFGICFFLSITLSFIFKGIQTAKCRNQYFSTNVAFIKWRFSCAKVEAETTHLWACANQMESMNGLFLEQDCFGPNQVTLQCILILQRPNIAFVIIKALMNFNCILFEENLQQEKDRGGN